MRISDWSSDVCSSDLICLFIQLRAHLVEVGNLQIGALLDGAGIGSFLAQYHFRSEEHTSELQSLMRISYAVFCLKKKRKQNYQKKQQKVIELYQHKKQNISQCVDMK